MKLEDIKVGDVLKLTLMGGLETSWNYRLALPEGSTDDNLYYTDPYIFQLNLDSTDDNHLGNEKPLPFQYIIIRKDFVRGERNQIVVTKINLPKKGGFHRGGGQGGQEFLNNPDDFYWVSDSPIYKISKEFKMRLINWPNENPLEVKE